MLFCCVLDRLNLRLWPNRRRLADNIYGLGLRMFKCWHEAPRRVMQAALADPYFAGLSQPAREPSAQPVSKMAFEFERRKLQVDDVRLSGFRPPLKSCPGGLLAQTCNVRALTPWRLTAGLTVLTGCDRHLVGGSVCHQVRDLIYREILEYHPQMLADFLSNGMNRGANFMYPSAVDNFRRQCAPWSSRRPPSSCFHLNPGRCHAGWFTLFT